MCSKLSFKISVGSARRHEVKILAAIGPNLSPLQAVTTDTNCDVKLPTKYFAFLV